MDTRQEIIQLGDLLIREKGYNAFSFSDIGKELKIKNASIHYHFPSKKDLGIAIIQDHQAKLEKLIKLNANKDALEKLKAFISIYSNAKKDNRICIVGSLGSDYYTVDAEIQDQIKVLADRILKWVIEILEEGKKSKQLYFQQDTRTKALMVISNMLAALQLTRLTGKQDFELIKKSLIEDLTTK